MHEGQKLLALIIGTARDSKDVSAHNLAAMLWNPFRDAVAEAIAEIDRERIEGANRFLQQRHAHRPPGASNDDPFA